MDASALSAITRRSVADSAVKTGSFAVLFALVGYANASGYSSSYPTLPERLGFARSFGANKALWLFYGVPHDLLSVGGYSAWRIAGFFSIVAGVWGVLACVRALRDEEDCGRVELLLAGIVTRSQHFAAVLLAIAIGLCSLWLATTVGLAAAGLALGGSAYLALATVSPAFVFIAVAAVCCQLADGRRLALEISCGLLALAFAMRVIADTASGMAWMRWLTPLGWSEQLRPFSGAQPAVLALPLLAGAGLLALAGLLYLRRDLGSGLLRTSDSAQPQLRLLSSPLGLALREERLSLAAWIASTGLFALIIGTLSTAFSSASVPSTLEQRLHRIGGAAITNPAGALGFYFLFFVLIISLFACSQIAAARREEADGRLETLLALPFGRERWLAGRLLLAVAGCAAVALGAGVLAWAGAAAQQAGVSLARMLEAGANCLPAPLMFLGLCALALALVPRASIGVGYGLVMVAFVWELFGALLGAPHWLVDLTPFQHIGLVPAQPFRASAAAVMLLVAAGSAIGASLIFRRRDLTGH